ncbi:5'-nucleotidase, lipoprotein e(P4) family [Luteimonas sp. MC1750]|uniref:5'-nucleotidase, lipoprotein e(P4) family n=1 Tax=Luteimonas sp. MC1750 TaxID=2799326 RepID=UPI0018F0FB35|nr:5'-nucleotidase, lipoprotein e(P4) family [Luteimonas sp. MC1750]MBJ6985136.1 5'-nucleotidase, lipoprotein e(P4) family [Luteimonas sp. MC1750]QQO05792.1 5'-nucleotidase, lipoprotein e(P4) family [Luteimonas sp. MC1750]
MRLQSSPNSLRAATLLAAALALAGCRSLPVDGTTPAPHAGAASSAAVPADDNLNAVLWVQRSVEYRALSESVFRAATERLDAALADRSWDALVAAERSAAGDASNLPPAVILDIDETVLDNSAYQARLVVDGQEFSDPAWDAWVEERKAIPVPGALDFTRAAAAKGITVFYISNRSTALSGATLDNLRSQGLPVQHGEVFLGLGLDVPGCEQAGSGKTCRRQLVGRTHRVLMQFGDQLGDFVQAGANTPAQHAALHADHRDWFGARWWVLPNPTYGSWESAAFDNARSLPRDSRRARKRGALRTDR